MNRVPNRVLCDIGFNGGHMMHKRELITPPLCQYLAK